MFRVTGCDFGGSKRAGEQARKIILIEAERLTMGHYVVSADGRNQRLVRSLDGPSWSDRRRGWTVTELTESLNNDASVQVAAFDFPFSLPCELLESAEFARSVGQAAFQTRRHWVDFIAETLPLEFSSERANAELQGIASFDAWRSRTNWCKRRTDIAARAQPPLKDRYQNLFAMTLVGCAMLRQLEVAGLRTLLDPRNRDTSLRYAIESYPAAVAREVSVDGSYKQNPADCVARCLEWLERSGIVLSMNERVQEFCTTYESSAGDHDGADAFLCLVAAIAFAEGRFEALTGAATKRELPQEGAIIVPSSSTR